jgi:hypothetical protein
MPTLTRRDWCKTLCYRDGRKWQELPPWAVSLIDIGWSIGNRPATDEKLAVCIIVPDRRFASAFLALGHLLAQSIPIPTVEDIDKHFEGLLALPDPSAAQTSLIYLKNGRSIRGRFHGVSEEAGKSLIRVCIQEKASDRSGGATLFIDRTKAGDLHIDPEPHDRLGRNIKGRAMLKNRSFLKNVYEPHELNRLHILGLPTACIVGRVNALHNEVLNEVFACRESDGSASEGVLNDIIKVDRFTPTSSRPRVHLVPTASESSIEIFGGSHPEIAIMDGSDSYLKWSHYFKSLDTISILCHTDSQLDDAVANINERYVMRSERPDDRTVDGLAELRRGFDGIAFWEARR